MDISSNEVDNIHKRRGKGPMAPLHLKSKYSNSNLLFPESQSQLPSPSSTTTMQEMRPPLPPRAHSSSPVSFKSPRSPCSIHRFIDKNVDMERILTHLSVQEPLQQQHHSNLVKTATAVREVAKQISRSLVKTRCKSVMIVHKARDKAIIRLTREVAIWLMSTPRYGQDGVKVYIDSHLSSHKLFRDEKSEMLGYWSPDMCWRCPEMFDLVITLGGDGTVLYTSWLFQQVVPPILAFGLGSLGFLTNFKFENYKEELNGALNDGIRVNLRMRFHCSLFRFNGLTHIETNQFEVLNEIVVDRGHSPWLSQLELFGDGHLITIVQADGMILSTPTGSTAYSLSAGGSLVSPEIPATLLTPICPHTLSFRPMLLPDSMQLKLVVPFSSRAVAFASFDGRGRVELKKGDYVTITASQFPFPTALKSNSEWIDNISQTLRWNVRERQKEADASGVFDSSDEEVESDDEEVVDSVAGPESLDASTSLEDDDADGISQSSSYANAQDDNFDSGVGSSAGTTDSYNGTPLSSWFKGIKLREPKFGL